MLEPAYFQTTHVRIRNLNGKSGEEIIPESTQLFVQVVWEVFNVIKENMPAHVDISYEGPLTASLGSGLDEVLTGRATQS